jgi:hypothetical protein
MLAGARIAPRSRRAAPPSRGHTVVAYGDRVPGGDLVWGDSEILFVAKNTNSRYKRGDPHSAAPYLGLGEEPVKRLGDRAGCLLAQLDGDVLILSDPFHPTNPTVAATGYVTPTAAEHVSTGAGSAPRSTYLKSSVKNTSPVDELDFHGGLAHCHQQALVIVQLGAAARINALTRPMRCTRPHMRRRTLGMTSPPPVTSHTRDTRERHTCDPPTGDERDSQAIVAAEGPVETLSKCIAPRGRPNGLHRGRGVRHDRSPMSGPRSARQRRGKTESRTGYQEKQIQRRRLSLKTRKVLQNRRLPTYRRRLITLPGRAETRRSESFTADPPRLTRNVLQRE